MLLPVTLFLGIAHLAVITNGKPLKRWEDLVVKHSWIDIPGGWEYRAPAPADYVFDLKIGMKQHRIDELITNLMEISDPEHPRFVFSR
jgi:tripeptidyl-peptidase-1